MRETIGRYAEVTVYLLAFDCIMNKGKIKMSGIEKSIWVILIILDYHLLEVKLCTKQIVRPYVRNRSYVRFYELWLFFILLLHLEWGEGGRDTISWARTIKRLWCMERLDTRDTSFTVYTRRMWHVVYSLPPRGLVTHAFNLYAA